MLEAGEEGSGQVVGKQRLEALSDGLYAIALTLLVLDLKVPALAHDASNADLLEALRPLLPRVLTWLLSFWVMATMWIAQARSFRWIRWLSPAMLRLQLAILAAVSLMPFSTGLLSEHGNLPVAAIVYGANLLVIAVLATLRTRVQVRDAQAQGHPVERDVQRTLYRHQALLVACCAGTVVLAFFWPPWNTLAMLPLLLRRRTAHA